MFLELVVKINIFIEYQQPRKYIFLIKKRQQHVYDNTAWIIGSGLLSQLFVTSCEGLSLLIHCFGRLFSLSMNLPLGRFSNSVAMFVCLFVCVWHLETPSSWGCGDLWSKNVFLILGCDDTIFKKKCSHLKKYILVYPPPPISLRASAPARYCPILLLP